jgi:hypothetical protein
MTETTIRLLDGDTRDPRFHLNYRGRVRPDPRVPLGPNTLGEGLWPVTVTDQPDGGTRVGLSYVAAPKE